MNNKLFKRVIMVVTGAALLSTSAGFALDDSVVKFNTQEVVCHKKIASLEQASPKELLAETPFFQATSSFVEEKGGPLTNDILKELKQVLSEEEYKHLRIDVKVQTIVKNTFSNHPGWHCDYFADYDEKAMEFKRYNPGLEESTRIFMITSGEPRTEFINQQNIEMDINGSTWKKISDAVDSLFSKDDLWRIPSSTLVEAKGNELHRVTRYEGEKPTVRYFLRATVFPKGHTESGKFHNEIYNWATHNPKAS
jgi:hypothetical protein